MLWRVVLFVGVLIAVLMVGASIALAGQSHHAHACTFYGTVDKYGNVVCPGATRAERDERKSDAA